MSAEVQVTLGHAVGVEVPAYPISTLPLVPTTPTRPGWSWHRLTDIARLATGHTPSRRCPEYWTGDIPWIQLPDIRALDGKLASDTSEHTNAAGIDNSAAVLLPAGTVCLSRTASVGFVTIMGRPMATSQDFVNWVCGPELHPEFLMHLLIACRKPIRELGSGAVHHTIYFPTVKAFSVCIPPIAEQERIAARLTAALSAVDRARRAADEQLAAAEALPAAYLREVFEGPDAGGWEVASLNAIAAIGGGIQKTPARAPKAHHRPYLTVRNVQRGYLDLTQTERFELTPTELERLRLQRGDILIVEGNGSVDHIGRNAVFNLDGEEWIHQNHIIRVRLDPSRAGSEFVALYLNSDAGKRQMVEKARSTSGLFTLSVDKVGSLTVPLPPVVEQQRLAVELGTRLAAAEAVAARCREEVAAVSALPAALLREAFGSTPNDGQP